MGIGGLNCGLPPVDTRVISTSLKGSPTNHLVSLMVAWVVKIDLRGDIKVAINHLGVWVYEEGICIYHQRKHFPGVGRLSRDLPLGDHAFR